MRNPLVVGKSFIIQGDQATRLGRARVQKSSEARMPIEKKNATSLNSEAGSRPAVRPNRFPRLDLAILLYFVDFLIAGIQVPGREDRVQPENATTFFSNACFNLNGDNSSHGHQTFRQGSWHGRHTFGLRNSVSKCLSASRRCRRAFTRNRSRFWSQFSLSDLMTLPTPFPSCRCTDETSRLSPLCHVVCRPDQASLPRPCHPIGAIR